MNMQFKFERREMPIFHLKNDPDEPSIIRKSYWELCEEFIELMDYKRTQNLAMLSRTNNLPDLIE